MNWQSQQYLKFQKERTQPASDLISRLADSYNTIVDLGCGPGNSTNQLGKKFENSHILGLDNSPEMITRARQDYPNYHFDTCDLTEDLSHLGQFDLVFSNACLQWVPNHLKLLPQLKKLVAPTGTFAVQIPMNYQQPIHLIIQKIVSTSPWQSCFTQVRQQHILAPDAYFDIMTSLYSHCDLWTTTYYHPLASHKEIIEWYRGTGLLPYLAQLSEQDIPLFLAAIEEQVVLHYPAQKNGSVLFPFPRFFMIGKNN